jgi:hypothetical protein
VWELCTTERLRRDFRRARRGPGRFADQLRRTLALTVRLDKLADGRVTATVVSDSGCKTLQAEVHQTVSPARIDERVVVYNECENTDLGRFSAVLAAVNGQGLTCAEVTSEQ